jgi:cytochrome P450
MDTPIEIGIPSPNIPGHVPEHLVQDVSFHNAPGIDRDPAAVLDSMRDDRNIVWGIGARRGKDGWMIKNYDLMIEAYRRPDLFSSKGFSGISALLGEDWLLIPPELDPPAHTGFRKFLTKFFTPSRMTEAEPGIKLAVHQLTDAVLPLGRCEFQESVATPLPTSVFLTMFGLPLEDAKLFLGWAAALLRSVDDVERTRGARAIRDYMVDAIKDRMAHPKDDMMSSFSNAVVDGRPLELHEKLGMCVDIYLAGLDTVTNSIATVFMYLAQNQGQQAFLRDNPDHRAKAIEEIVRTRSNVNNARFVTQDMLFHGVEMKRGDRVVLPTMFANRDGAHFKNPGEIDLQRENVMSHIVFGSGIHNCLGAHLARRELKIVTDEWLDRVPPFRIPDSERAVTYASGAVFGVDQLPLEW